MSQITTASFDALRPRLDAALDAREPAAIAQEVKAALEYAMRQTDFTLPARFYEAREDTYARRLLHRDDRGRYTVVVMTWGPGQKTALHDHAGIWCVECVVDGEMEVTQYNLVSQSSAGYQFEQQSRVRAGRGAAGCLIPPFEYHTLGNLRPDGASITLHVYGGEMDHCHVFEPSSHGTWQRFTRQLSYHD